ncbi:rod shape-determining protein MreC [Campylobacter hyointestinalis]|uniref:rod shape-determining protein MreC n=1 Tax=Campylobacter hyointestinalis TaxID=198 RepID=UPI000CE37624|nr:rod shape-determining protein MreC [Campylobacter hyointestinalis]PPB55278.1 rod shape-determining protein MreC [Campylobacter hyointestinalis subsp. hyointestinalis]PPB62492.1 rod shape-determining protein MreC [Campylobacter hyointestinalis subsp. hyointestinalis]PPB64116.1 rod shape-determining protein MreC [Campylobacter hyointestinalis subsp. hyointestinalis]
MKNKIKFILVIGFFVLSSIYFSENVRSIFVNSTNSSIGFYDNFINSIKNKINEHFRQVEEIRALRAQNAELEKSAALLSTFAYELNNILSDRNVGQYSPKIKQIRALSYVNIGDYDKVWLDFKDFDPDKIYGLIYRGKTAGIIVNKDGSPQGLLQTDPNSIFSVYIGNNKIAGIAKGNNKNIVIKYISRWLNPKPGDMVYTTGLDGIFFGGIPVGKVISVNEEDLYKSVIVEPDNKIEVPSYLYVVIKED